VQPQGRGDFDVSFGLDWLVFRREVADRSVWTTSWWHNFLGAAFASLMAATVSGLYLSHTERMNATFAAASWAMQLFQVVLLLILFLGFLFLLVKAVFRGRLVLDRGARVLRVYHWGWPWPRHQLGLSEIQRIAYETFFIPGDYDSAGSDDKVLFAELHDGRLLLIASGMKEDERDLGNELRHAIGAKPFLRAR